ncbi:uncharacterized protein BJX67DRAFT_366076 [Aspergillus lucknowensis]|uniref:NAD(P)-binding domain-containing protein n=1 Tax=Aspergillus lucknowensis TaxID=176173 RepID=A0ABR4LDG5_9EURO
MPTSQQRTITSSSQSPVHKHQQLLSNPTSKKIYIYIERMTIAIAGSGDLTRYLTEELLAAAPKTPVVLLVRTEKPHFANLPNVSQLVVDYTSIPALTNALNKTKTTTLISTILTYNAEEFITAHKNLITAAQNSTHCTRFIPSEYGVDIEKYPDQPGFYFETREPIRQILRGQSRLEWTLLCCGWLVDYIVPVGKRYLKDIGDAFPVNLAGGRVVIPGTGGEVVAFTAARDLARAIAALVLAPAGSGGWEEYIFLAGEQITLDKLAEVVKGKYPETKFDVEKLSLRMLVNAYRDAKDDFEKIDAEYKIVTVSGACEFDEERVQRHREKYFSGVRFRGIKEILDAADAADVIV